MVELELLHRGERAVALLDQLETAPLELAKLVEHIARWRRFPEKRARHEQHREHREHRGCDQPEGHAGMAPAAYRSARRRCSTASGHIATSAPKTNRNPAAQIRLTSGFTSAFRYSVPPLSICSAIR